MSGKVGRKMVGSRSFLGLSAVLIAVIVGIVACGEDSRGLLGVGNNSSTVAANEKGGQNPYAFVGEEHNAEVDHVLREFAKQWKKSMKQPEVCAALDKIVDDYVAKHGRSKYNFRYRAASDPCQSKKESERGSLNVAALRSANVGYDANFSTRAIDLVNEIEAVMASASSAADVANRLVPINNAAYSELSGTDAALVLSVSSIAQSSSAYWEANLETWVTVYSQGGSPGVIPTLRLEEAGVNKVGGTRPYGIDWNAIGRVSSADLGGGIVGGIRGILGGPGGVVMGAVTGAAYGSIGGAISEIIRIIAKT